MRKRRKRTFRLIIYMILCMTATALVFTGSVKCGSCGRKVERKYYITEYHEPLCLSCAGKYYRDSNILKNKYFQKNDNSLKTIFLLGEGCFFAVFIVCVNIRRKKPVKQIENGYTSGVDSKVRSIIFKESLEYPEREKTRKTVKEPVKKRPCKPVEEPVKKTTGKPVDKKTVSSNTTKTSPETAGDSVKPAKKSSVIVETKKIVKNSASVKKSSPKKEISENKQTKKTSKTKK